MRRPRHIMMTTDTVGGVWTYASTLADACAQRGDRVTLVTLGAAPNAQQRETLPFPERIDLVVTDLALEWMDPSGEDFARAGDALLALAHERRPDVVHLNSFREGALAWPAPSLVVAHSCVSSWWEACRDVPLDEPRWRRYQSGITAGLAAADAWVAPSAAFRDAIAQLYSPPTAGIVIHNGTEARSAPRPKHDVVFASGRLWDQAKNLTSLLAVAPELPWRVEVAGPSVGPNGEAAPRASNVLFLGTLPRARLRERMAGAAIYVSAARYEPFGLGVLEAATEGCALVLSDIPTHRELWGDAALFVDPSDDDALRVTLRMLCQRAETRETLQQAAIAQARQYSLAATADRYDALYGALIDAGVPALSHGEART